MVRESDDLDPQLVSRLRRFADGTLSRFDPERVASAAIRTPARPMWQLAATVVAAAAVVVIAVGVARSGSDGVSLGEQPPALSSVSAAPVESEPVAATTPSSTTMTSGLTEAEAVAAARAAAPQTADQPLLSAHIGPAGELLVPAEAYPTEPPLPPDRLVWKLVFGSGSGFDAQGTIVVVDALDASVYTIIDWIS